jgi:multiple sugar transport system permease protein
MVSLLHRPSQTRGRVLRAEARAGHTFVALVYVPVTLFLILPLAGAFVLSFTDFTPAVTQLRFVGLDNYRELFNDPQVAKTLFNTFQYVIETVPLTIAMAFGFALLVNRPIRGVGLFRTAYFLPTVTSFIAVGVIWTSLFDPYSGLFAKVLGFFGVEPTNWLTDPTYAMHALAIVTAWKAFGLSMLIYLAGLQSLPESYFEAASLDGAGRVKIIRYITWPLLRPVTFYLVITGMISSFQAFDLIVVMTQGGPMGSTSTLVYDVYENAFVYNRMGFASALSFVLFIIILVLTLSNIALFRDTDGYE